jgi:hypothetical protein
MKKYTRFVMVALLFNLAMFTFASGSNPSDSGNSRPEGGPEQDRPMPSESELTVVKLQYLAEVEEEAIALTTDQAVKIIPILEEWQDALMEDSETDPETFVERITLELTEQQNAMLPPPPGGERGSQGGDGAPPQGGNGAPPQGDDNGRPSNGPGPEKMDMTEMLSDAINALQEV